MPQVMDLLWNSHEMGNVFREWFRFRSGRSSRSLGRTGGFRQISAYHLLAAVVLVVLSGELGYHASALVFKNGLPEYLEVGQGRSLIGAGGVILDIPKIRVLRYKIRNSDPHVVSDELDCEGGECGEVVEPPQTKYLLGTNSAKEATEWAIPRNVTQLVIECKSRSGVVEWEYEGSGLMSEIEVESNRIVGDFWSPSTYLHVSLLTFNKISDQLTGKYTCKNLDKSSKSNSFYLFVPQPKSEVMNDGRKLEIMPPSHADEVVIPCRMEKRTTPVYLFRKGSDGVHRKVPLRGRMRFDPFQGFILPITPDVWGDYVCKVDKKSKKKNKVKREVIIVESATVPSIAMMPPKPPKSVTSTRKPSPGFSAFPNSMELSEIVQTEADAAFLSSLLGDEHSTLPPEMVLPPVPATQSPSNSSQNAVMSFQPYKQRKNRPYRRRKRPFMRRRHQGGLGGTANNMLTRRNGGPFANSPGPPPPGRGAAFLKHRLRPVYHPHQQSMMTSPMLDPQGSSIVPVAGGNGGSGGMGTALPVQNHPLHHHHHHHHHPHSMGSHYHGYQHHSHSHPHHKSHFHGPPGMAHPRLPPGAGAVAGVLPTFQGNYGSSQELVEKITHASSEALSSLQGMLGPGEKFIAETLMSRVDSTRPPMSMMMKPPPKKPVSMFAQNFLPPTNTVIHTMQCVLKKMVLGADVPCNASLADGIAERHGATKPSNPLYSDNPDPQPNSAKEQKTILEVTLLPPPENKFFPPESAIFTTTPFFVKWETRFTDYANWAEVNHTVKLGAFKRHRAEEVADFENGVNALEVYDVPEGETGNITVTYMGGRKEIKTHTWHYLIINGTTFANKGLKQTVDGVVKVFMCRSATSKRPHLTLSRLTENGCPEQIKDPFSAVQDYTEEDCGVGCTLIRTKIEQGIVTCIGDGVEETLMFPEEMQCTGRPYFISRGQSKNLTLSRKGNRLLIPCIINNPNADVYLFHSQNGKMAEVTDNSTYDLKAGFYFDTGTVDDPYGTFLCTSTPDTEDETDMVKFHVTPMEDYVFYPSYSTVWGSPPFKFMWEGMSELEVVNGSTIGKFDQGMFAKTDGGSVRPHVGSFEVFPNLTDREGSWGEVKVVRKSDKKVVHTWHFKHINKVGLSIDKERNLFRCQAATENQPMLYAIPCDNPNVCKLERKHFDEEDEDIKSGRENSHCGDGCVQLKIWRNRPLGFVRCQGDGVDETLQYFLTQNSTILTEEDTSTLEKFRIPQILNGVRRLRVGETADFICKANRYFYSKGFQWAIETRNGQKKFIDAKVREDVILKDEIRSVINLKILDAEWKSVWCYTPELTSNQWANISQPIYLR